MTQDNSHSKDPQISKKEADRYTGMAEIDFAMSPSVVVCGAAGAVLGFILAMWATSEVPIAFATTIVFGVLSGIFGLFVPWWKPR
jgi:hypothetical protein